MDICYNGDILSIIRIGILVINLIRIVGPIALLIMLGIDIFKAITGNEKDLRELVPFATKRILAALAIFLVPLIVSFFIGLVSTNSIYPCIQNATKENIKAVYIESANKAIKQASTTLSGNDYNAALQAIYKVNDENTRKELIAKLDEINLIAQAGNLLTSAEILRTKDAYNKASEAIKKITDNKIKTEYTTRLNKIKIIEYSSGGLSGNMPTNFGQSLNIASSFNKYNDFKHSGLAGYYLYIPQNASANMPLIVVLPPNSLAAPDMVKMVQRKSLSGVPAFIYIPILSGGSSTIQWGTGHSTAAVKQLTDIANKYYIDKTRISLTAFSSSGYSIYWTANTYRIFSAIVPISSGMTINGIKNYSNWEYLKTLPMKGFGEKGGKFTADGRSCQRVGWVNWSAKSAMSGVFNALGKSNDFTYLPNVCHGEMGSYVFGIDGNGNGISDIIEWMVSQQKTS